MAKGAAQKPSEGTRHSSPAMDLKARIHEHSLFFDRLVDLIPARFYVPVPDADERPWFHGLSKSAKASAKKESRENIKKARRARYDPERAASTLDLLKKNIDDEKKSFASLDEEKPNSDGDSGSDREAEVEDPHPVVSSDRPVTYEELRRRLHRRIEELRGNRNTRTVDKDERREKKKKNKMQTRKGEDVSQRKRKRDEESNNDGHDAVKRKEENKRVKFDDISYGRVKLGGVEERGRKKRKFSKHQELEKAKKLEDAKKDPEKGKVVAEKHSWKTAMSRAVGEKVHDDSKVLRQSLKKEQKRHQKHAEKWKERIESQIKVREEKQKTRTENIRERIQQKKKRRIEKREKKLMRPGFEGRKDGYINQ
ncbi:ribosomal RNA-processing protein 14-C [Phalaenopsis equestris]|uniref:ribosomal RNA-processing protein 14-C n=1 Tax=Phalaenopsis equestris TaxID=78828 RepID=UPI0009E61BD6|nr:ribosomal RNA-processing protein 14-C [Phalaenopsis equestris]XP_020597683.1 ribosomal RNA-processing protein 14-C [Phalaenopsis equestris]XP_020597684.1 ribosomal RNA-processing protein 14-C [Phalaenopsis equestris]XP_020597685.1 ribosomal RNA-processing protein 14-C [Phalaenopsis equestris]